MSVKVIDGKKVVDVRNLPPYQRHGLIFSVFDELEPGEEMLIVNDHEPIHLLHHLKHERRDFDEESYRAYEKEPGMWIAVLKKKRVENKKYVYTNFDKERNYNEEEFNPVPIHGTKDYRVLLTFIKAGQFIPVHEPNIDLIFLIRSGKGTFVAGDDKISVKEGDIIVVPAGVKRGIYAEEDIEALHVVIPPPSDRDHHVVAEKLKRKIFE
ncbi:MAG TPA: DUF2249 domain-containing protein [Geobacterales bacterium]|nr:DUF2249 domain-containing protein [Geobacterales bacterium]